jgi:hypothetical protein
MAKLIIPPEKRRYIRVMGTDKTFQMTDAFAKRLGKDMVEVSYKAHVALRDRLDAQNVLDAQEKQESNIQLAQDDTARAGGRSKAQILKDLAIPGALPPGMSADEAMRKIIAESGDDDGVRIADGVRVNDGLDEMNRNDLIDVIAREELPVKKQGKKEDIVVAIRTAREKKKVASVDPESPDDEKE